MEGHALKIIELIRNRLKIIDNSLETNEGIMKSYWRIIENIELSRRTRGAACQDQAGFHISQDDDRMKPGWHVTKSIKFDKFWDRARHKQRGRVWNGHDTGRISV